MSRRLVPAIFVIGSLATLAACGNSMTAPSSAAATITGTVTTTGLEAPASSGPSDDAAEAAPPANLTVSIVGSNIQVTVDGANHFTLSNVPSGDVLLRFHGSTVDATITVPAVQAGEDVTIGVSVNGDTATLESDDRSSTSGSLLQLEGRIAELPPASAAGTFVINGTTVETNASTTFVNGGVTAAFADLLVGVRVHVSGTADGTKLLATRVDIQNTDATLPIEVNGTVSGLTGTAASFQFVVNGTTIKGTSATAFVGNSTFADLANGTRVEVKGEPGNGFVTADSIHVN
jgi:acyl-coenzyme A thioesterase PaaI-like protein